MKQNRSLLKSLMILGIMLAVITIMFITYNHFKPKGEKGSKNVVVEVVIPDEESKEFTINTDAEFLRQALEEENLVKGTEDEFGLFITEVNGRAIDESKNEWWCITKSGATVEYGVDQIEIADGDHYEVTLSVY